MLRKKCDKRKLSHVSAFSALWALLAVGAVHGAEPLHRAPSAPFGTEAKPLLASLTHPLVAPDAQPEGASGPSLFAGRSAGSFFEPVPPRQPKVPQVPNTVEPFVRDVTDIELIRAVIGRAESRHNGYDAVNYGAKIKPKRRPTDMTLEEIYAWIDATPKQPHAIGKYQFIPKTLKRLVRHLDIPLQTTFSPAIQDRLSNQLLMEAGLQEVRRGEISRKAFMNNLTKIWAGLPMENGKSYYHGYAGNKASISYQEFDREMAKVFPS